MPLAPDIPARTLVLADGLSRDYLRHHRVAPRAYADDGRTLLVAAAPDARWRDCADDLREVYACDVRPEPAAAAEVDVLIERLATAAARGIELTAGSEPAATTLGQAVEDDAVTADVRDLATQPPVVRYVNLLVRDAYAAGASDVHLEAGPDGLRARVRLDGALVPAADPPPSIGRAVVSRVKLLAELDIAERRRPQDGRIRVRLEARDLDLRVSTVPTVFGESVVLRLLDHGGRPRCRRSRPGAGTSRNSSRTSRRGWGPASRRGSSAPRRWACCRRTRGRATCGNSSTRSNARWRRAPAAWSTQKRPAPRYHAKRRPLRRPASLRTTRRSRADGSPQYSTRAVATRPAPRPLSASAAPQSTAVWRGSAFRARRQVLLIPAPRDARYYERIALGLSAEQAAPTLCYNVVGRSSGSTKEFTPSRPAGARARVRTPGREGVSTGVVDLLSEAGRMWRVPGVVFTDSRTGRRPTVAGTGVDVWKVVAIWHAVGEGEVEFRAATDWLAEAQRRAALNYCALYPAEIDARLADEEAWTAERVRERLLFAALAAAAPGRAAVGSARKPE